MTIFRDLEAEGQVDRKTEETGERLDDDLQGLRRYAGGQKYMIALDEIRCFLH